MKNKGKTILIGLGDVFVIEDIVKDIYYKCRFIEDDKNKFMGVMIKIESCVESDKDGIDFESLPKAKRDEIKLKRKEENGGYKTLTQIACNTDFLLYDIKVGITGYDNEMSVVKTTDKMIFFVDDNGKTRRSAFKNITSLKNYSPNMEVPEMDSDYSFEETEKETTTKKRKRKSKKRDTLGTAVIKKETRNGKNRNKN